MFKFSMIVGLGCIIYMSYNLITRNSDRRQVPAWEHGVVLCNANVIMINLGHENDPQVAELLKLASTCNKE